MKVEIDKERADWLMNLFDGHLMKNAQIVTLQQIKNNYEENFEDFELFWFSKPVQQLKDNGVILSL